MESNSQVPTPPFRSFSAASSASLNSSTTSITRVALGPILAMHSNMNRQGSKEEHLYYQCTSLKQKLTKIEGIKPYMDLAFEAAEQCTEQQALALSQKLQKNSRTNGNPSEFRGSMGSLGMSLYSNLSSATSIGGGMGVSGSGGGVGGAASLGDNIFTFTAGVLPACVGVDPVTQLWKLFQQGAPLCLIFNSIVSDYSISVVASDDLRVCKKSVYDFLIAVKTHLNFDDEMMFTISNVFLDSSHDLIKVVKVVNKLLLLNTSKYPASFEVDQIPIGELSITDERSKVLREMIETERKYVQDLELLLQYKDELQRAELISSEQIHILFPNLNEIIDFQRRFLIGLECNVNVPYKFQRIGSIFIHAANGPFKAYEPWTIGQLSAIDLINKELKNLKKSSSLLDPGFELQSYIIKPIQRLCKYPLLLKELIKTSPESVEDNNAPYSTAFNELLLASGAVKEVANQVNEAQRRSENVGYLQSLIERVYNWRGFDLKDQGELLHHSVVGVKDSESEKEYVAYLFEKIIFFFVESGSGAGGSKEKEKKKRELLPSRKKSSTNSMSTSNLLDSLQHAKDKTTLELKGRVYILEIYNVSVSNNQGYTLVISWSGKKESGSFTLRYRTEELRNQWEACLRALKANEMNNLLNRKVRNSHGSEVSQATNESSLYDLTSAYANTSPSTPNYNSILNHEAYSRRSSNGSSHRHHSSSSTFSMMRQARTKSSNDYSNSVSTTTPTSNPPSNPNSNPPSNPPSNPNSRFSSSSLSNPGTSGFSEKNDSSFLSASTSPENTTIAIKLIYGQIEIPDPLFVAVSISYSELHLKISSKIASSDEVHDDIMVNKLKYKDEDGDFVVMDSHDDWVLAIDMLDEFTESTTSKDRCLTIWVS